MEPSRLVCPTVATALAGTTTSGLTEISTSACQSLDRHLADAADDDVVDQHRRIRFQRRDIRDLDVIGGGVRIRAPPRRAAAASSGPGRRSRSASAQRTTRRSVNRCHPANHDGGVPSAGSSGALGSAGGGAVGGSSMPSTAVSVPAGMVRHDVGRTRNRRAWEQRGRRSRGRVVAALYRPCGGRLVVPAGGRRHVAHAGVGRHRRRRLGRVARPCASGGQLRIGVDRAGPGRWQASGTG